MAAARLFPVRRQRGAGADDRRRCSSDPAELARVRERGYAVHARVHLAADRRAVPASSARRAGPADAPQRCVAATAPRASSLPELRLDHLLRLTDDTGIIQHATFSVPARDSGYCVDDNARALIVALHADRLTRLRGHQAARLDVSRLSSRRADARTAASGTS